MHAVWAEYGYVWKFLPYVPHILFLRGLHLQFAFSVLDQVGVCRPYPQLDNSKIFKYYLTYLVVYPQKLIQ